MQPQVVTVGVQLFFGEFADLNVATQTGPDFIATEDHDVA